MAVLEILTYPDPRLEQQAQPVAHFDDELQTFIADLEETRRAGPGAVGIAAPQVGRSQRIVIVDISSKPKNPNHGHLVLINPEITEWEGFAVVLNNLSLRKLKYYDDIHLIRSCQLQATIYPFSAHFVFSDKLNMILR